MGRTGKGNVGSLNKTRHECSTDRLTDSFLIETRDEALIVFLWASRELALLDGWRLLRVAEHQNQPPPPANVEGIEGREKKGKDIHDSWPICAGGTK